MQFNLNYKVKNSSSMPTAQAKQYSKQIASQVESSFQGNDIDNKTKYSASASFEMDQNAGEGDFYIEFVQDGDVINVKTGKAFPVSFGVQGSVNQKGGNSQENRSQVQEEADNIVKTAAHELGHTAGLDDPNPNNKAEDKSGIKLESDNLMQQGKDGTKINIQQLRKMEKTIDDDIKGN